MKQKQIIALVSATALAATALAGCGKTSEENPQTTAVKEAEGTAKEDLPFSKYAETVTVHLGGSMNPNAKIPDGMSYEDNSYTRLLEGRALISRSYTTGLHPHLTLMRK